MFVKEMVIDGLKSYATRTVIKDFDRHFNAITGPNGSGKSNILDAICFLLGITNLQQVRARNLQELVYKQGQTGVTKATVSITFDNSDTASSPVGYESYSDLTITRQVVMGGRNKYLINGHNANQTAVQNLFHSVQLNVNNPHFLIMQGRITKVLNMKPAEILGMVEEAAGTRMFENKKQGALKTMAKKQTKVVEINEVLANEIMPLLEKLCKQRADYDKWSSQNAECERLERIVVAYRFCKALKASDAAAGEAEGLDKELATLHEVKERAEAVVEEKSQEIATLSAQRDNSMEGSFKEAQTKEEALSKKLVQVNSAWQNKKTSWEEEIKNHKNLQKQAAESEAGLEKLAQAFGAQKELADAAAGDVAAAKANVDQLQEQYQGIVSGLSAGNGAAGGNLADQLKAQERLVQQSGSDYKAAEMRLAAVVENEAEVAAEFKACKNANTSMQRKLDKAVKQHAAVARKLEALQFDGSSEDQLRSAYDATSSEVATLTEALEAKEAKLSARLRFNYDAAAVARACGYKAGGRNGAGAGRGAGAGSASGSGSGMSEHVKGVVARLVRVKDPKSATALEAVAGGKLFQVVVDTEQTGKALLKHGKLRQRVTIIPLNKIRHDCVKSEVVRTATAVSNGHATTALSLVGYDDEVAAAMEYVFGRAFVCRDAKTARAVTFHKGIRTKSVTLQGDSFDPAGTIEGGSKPAIASVLLTLQQVADLESKLAVKKEELQRLEASLTQAEALAAQHATLSGEVDIKKTEVELLRSQIAQSQHGQFVAKLEALAQQKIACEEGMQQAQVTLADAQERVAAIKQQQEHQEEARQAAIKETQTKMRAAKKIATRAAAQAKAVVQQAEELELELEQAKADAVALQKQVEVAATTVAALAKEVDALAATVHDVRQLYDAARAELEQQRGAIAAADKQLRALCNAKEAAMTEASKAELAARKVEHDIARLQKETAGAQRAVTSMLEKHPWIETEKQFFGKPHTDYDFKARNPEAASKRVKTLRADLAALAKSLNKKVIGMIETAEKEYNDLMTKKRIIEADKAKINRVIEELDAKKNVALKRTWEKVNKDFGSIFSTLLPGTTAKLEPPEGLTVLDGLQVMVAFNGVWKESLSELSGGQRSLLALSLILSLLLFKPAPMYILDEVDAALDLSHTQNIGQMLKSHFKNSQFIVVSLKEGMFSNANVLFKTKFVDGISRVTRTVPAQATRQEGTGVGAGAGAGAENPVEARPAKTARPHTGRSRRRAVA